MVAVHDEHRRGLAAVGRVDQHAALARLLNEAFDRRAVRADDGDQALGGHHVAKSDVQQLHLLRPLLDVLHRLADLFDLRLERDSIARDGDIVALEPMVLLSRLTS